MTRREDEWKDKPTNPQEVVSTQGRDAEGLPGREGTGWRHRGNGRIGGGLQVRGGRAGDGSGCNGLASSGSSANSAG